MRQGTQERCWGSGTGTLRCSSGGCRCRGRSSSEAPSSLQEPWSGNRRRRRGRRKEPTRRWRMRRSPGPEPPCTETRIQIKPVWTVKVYPHLDQTGIDCSVVVWIWFGRLTLGHRGQPSWDMKARSSIPGTRSRAGPCRAWDWLVSAVWVGPLLVHCGGCSRALGSGMLGNAAGSWAQ